MGRYFAILVFFLNVVFGAVAFGHQAKAGDHQILNYDVYAGGIHAVEVEVHIDTTDPARYSSTMFAKTRGFLGRLAPWSGLFESHGRRDDGVFRPSIHKSTTTWRAEEEVKEYRYDADGRFGGLFIKEHDKEEPRKETPDTSLTYNTTDVLSAALGAFDNVLHENSCASRARVFDGKRNFDMVFHALAVEDLQASRYNIYQGAAEKCTVEVIPGEGKWHKKPRGWLSIQEQGREKGTMPTLWLASLSEDGPAVPLKVMVRTDYGTLFMHLTAYKNNDKFLIAEKRK